ncbi:hypothetical protein OUM58_004364 [Proteus mirabilis]|nr:hypothetical protein [Proteus mirabilis]EMB6141576.1 hypothetical protein [Proteus mirabilis]
MAIDQIAQSGLSSLSVIYYSAQLFRKALDWLTPLEKFAQLVDYHMAFETVAPHV